MVRKEQLFTYYQNTLLFTYSYFYLAICKSNRAQPDKLEALPIFYLY